MDNLMKLGDIKSFAFPPEFTMCQALALGRPPTADSRWPIADLEDVTAMAVSAPPPWNLGFLTILNESGGYLGGYLVTNQWGRPLEFRLSTAVQPNRLQQILYGETLVPYICADLIGKTLVDKTTTAAQLIFSDHSAVLDLRRKLEMPVAWLAVADEPIEALKIRDHVYCHAGQAADAPAIAAALERLGPSFDLGEPFERIREAIAEARKMGVTNRG